MGYHRAHSIDELPPAIAADITRILAAGTDGPRYTEQEIADATARLAEPQLPAQRSLQLRPIPRDGSVDASSCCVVDSCTSIPDQGPS